MSEKKWFRVTADIYNEVGRLMGYRLSESAEDAIGTFALYGLAVNPAAAEVRAEDVPYKIRALTEATTEELVHELRGRRYNVTLTA